MNRNTYSIRTLDKLRLRVLQKALQLPLQLFLRLRVTQKDFQLQFFAFACNAKNFAIVIVFLFLFLLPSDVFRLTGKSYLQISPIAALTACSQDWTYGYDMPCAFKLYPSEINSNGGFNREYVESCSSSTENIVTLLPQYLWSGGTWAGW